ncbi:colorectal cancer associated 2 [Cottoperca gobio]|uniref:Colorectal cancer associated 2 n=1 Tax=Cottoperca gobio TaxID=56716 RepID=A0A6J2QXQ9_COTGO|nr:colorectal cancer-associated protein 2 [Cottoperca gobio]
MSDMLFLHADKPRVYQGVRVKTTVKELLQRHRAREANSKKVKTISQACSDLQELCVSSFPSRYEDPPPAIPPADARSCGARDFQLRAASFPVSDSSCNSHMQEQSHFNDIQQQFGDMMLPSNGYSGNYNNNTGSSYNASLPSLATFPLTWCHGLSSDADYYGHGMGPCSSPELLKLCNPVDHDSYSPQDSFSSSSSSCYDSPTRMEPSCHSISSEHYHYQHCNLQDGYCLPHCWPGQQESLSAPEYAPYYTPTDYPYTCPVEENYFKRDLQMSSEMCYNVL